MSSKEYQVCSCLHILLGSLLLLTLACRERRDEGSLAAAAISTIASGETAEPIVPKKLALVVAIAEYAPSSGWQKTGADRDVELIRGALARHGFDPAGIHVIRDSDATKERILGDIRHLLIDQAGPGDVVVLHYSGHGHQITDDNRDEIDGYDEVWVPYDAPKRPSAEYKGARHIRDDTLNVLVQELRRKVEPDGNVVVIIDACYSGSAARGYAPVRGSNIPIGEPAAGSRTDSVGGGGFDLAGQSTRGGAVGDESLLSPYVVFSASRHDELSREAEDDEGQWVGSLSLATSKALSRAGRETSYRALFHAVKREMAVLVPGQTPQAEGAVDVLIFSGRGVSQNPYFEVQSVLPGDTLVRLQGGSLVGLLPATEVEFHPVGTREPSEATRLAHGPVVRSRALNADVRVKAGGKDLGQSWAFVTRYSFGDLRIRVSVDDSLDPELRRDIVQALLKRPVVDTASSGAEVAVRQSPERAGEQTGLVVETTKTGTPIAALELGDARVAEIVALSVQDYARNRYLRRLEMSAPGLDVRFELIPVTLECTFDDFYQEESCTVTDTLKAQKHLTIGNQWLFNFGDGFLVRISNKGQRPAYVSILDLMPDGRIGLLWPLPWMTGQDNLLEPGRQFLIDVPYQVGEPAGTEVLKLIATQEPVNFSLMVTRGGLEGVRAPLGPLEALFDDVYRGTRSNPVVPRGDVSTFSLPLKVVPR